jgi:cytidine deaminase
VTTEIYELLNAADRARGAAYAPYSGFSVGAALLTRSGRVFTGSNVENISFGLTMCAERVCVGAAVAAGEREFAALAIVTGSERPTLPCGACRQVIAEFSRDLDIACGAADGSIEHVRLSDILPCANQGIDVPRRT